MTISSLRVRALAVPMPEPHRTASGVISESPLVLTDLITDDGVTGSSITFAYTSAALRPVALLIQNLESLIKGEPVAPAALFDKLHASFRLLGTQGVVGMAIAAIDMAAWDALARSQGMSLARLLGGTERPVRAYGAIGFDGAQGSAVQAERWAKGGFSGVKAKIGYPTIWEDLEVIRTIRSAAGPRMAIMVDYNQSLTPGEAVQRIRILEGEGLTWVEEPVASHDFTGHAQVAAAAATPIQAGENWWGSADLRQAIREKASDCVMFDAMKIGGVTGWLRASALAQAEGLQVSSHLWPELSAHLLSVTPTAHWLEYADWWAPVITDPLRIENGMALPGTAPGSGIQWNKTAVHSA